MSRWEPIWLFGLIAVETAAGLLTLYWVRREYQYDENKDLEKKQKRTRTTKKTTTQPSGVSTVEETSETVEPTQEEKK